MKKQLKKLTLRKETIVRLNEKLNEVKGAVSFRACQGTVTCGDYSLNASCVTACTIAN